MFACPLGRVQVKAGQKVALCRCYKSAKFPYCDGAHIKHNEDTGDNIAPVVLTGGLPEDQRGLNFVTKVWSLPPCINQEPTRSEHSNDVDVFRLILDCAFGGFPLQLRFSFQHSVVQSRQPRVNYQHVFSHPGRVHCACFQASSSCHSMHHYAR